jgi:hypothetical protein
MRTTTAASALAGVVGVLHGRRGLCTPDLLFVRLPPRRDRFGTAAGAFRIARADGPWEV